MAKAKSKTKTSVSPTLVTFLLDRSGSMETIRSNTIEAFNSYVEGLKEGGDQIAFTLLTFDSAPHCQIEKACVREVVTKVALLTRDTYQPRGGTPLVESAFKTIKAVEESLKGDKKTKVVICFQTDGEENSSGPEYTWEGLNTLIKEKTKAGWQFNFMGAGIDAYKQSARMGLSTGQTVSYDPTKLETTLNAFAAHSHNTMSFARGMSSDTTYTASQKLGSGDAYDPSLKTQQALQKASFMNIGGANAVGKTPSSKLDLSKETDLKL